jgi:glycosyltransferase involved in cell wall biosynthesis
MTLVSVVIPTFNRAGIVCNAIESALSQHSVNLEIIVVDDGSNDDTPKVLAPFLDRIRYVRTENAGVSSARNRGIQESRGDWIAFLDSDDTWSAHKLSKQLECLYRTGARVCFCVSADENGSSLDDLRKIDPDLPEGKDRFYSPGDCRLFKVRRHPFVQSMVVERSALLESGLFDQSLRVAEDTKLIYQLTLKFGYAVVNERMVTICRVRESPGLSDSSDSSEALLRYECYVRIQAEFYWRLLPLDLQAAACAERRMLYFASRLAEIHSALGNKSIAKRCARACLNARAGWNCVLRSLLILITYPVVRRRFVRKWSRRMS